MPNLVSVLRTLATSTSRSTIRGASVGASRLAGSEARTVSRVEISSLSRVEGTGVGRLSKGLAYQVDIVYEPKSGTVDIDTAGWAQVIFDKPFPSSDYEVEFSSEVDRADISCTNKMATGFRIRVQLTSSVISINWQATYNTGI